jgi:hypothetical protein
MPKTMTPPAPPNFADRISEAAAESGRLGDEAAALESQFKSAVDDERFDEAARLRALIPEAKTAAILASAQYRALMEVQQELQDTENKRAVEAHLAERKAAARGQQERAMLAESEALADARRYLAEAEAGIAAVRLSLRAAVSAEEACVDARQEQLDARVLLGEAETGGRVARPNVASARIEASAVLTAIMRGLDRL